MLSSDLLQQPLVDTAAFWFLRSYRSLAYFTGPVELLTGLRIRRLCQCLLKKRPAVPRGPAGPFIYGFLRSTVHTSGLATWLILVQFNFLRAVSSSRASIDLFKLINCKYVF